VAAHRSTFTSADIAELRELVRRLRKAERSEQKLIRARLRRIGFHISDYDATGAGFTVSDFDELLHRGVLSVSGRTGGHQGRCVRPPDPPTGTIAVERRTAGSDSLDRRETGTSLNITTSGVIPALSAPRHRLDEGDPPLPDRAGLYALYGPFEIWRLLGLGDPPDDRPLYVGKAEDSLVTRDLRTHFGAQRS